MPESIPGAGAGPGGCSDQLFVEYADLELTWCLWPRRCSVSGQRLWLVRAWRANQVIHLTGSHNATWTRWYSRNELLMLKLQGY